MSVTINGVRIPTKASETRDNTAKIAARAINVVRGGKALTNKFDMLVIGGFLNQTTDAEKRAFMHDLTGSNCRPCWDRYQKSGALGAARVWARDVATAAKKFARNESYSPSGDAKSARDWLLAQLNKI